MLVIQKQHNLLRLVLALFVQDEIVVLQAAIHQNVPLVVALDESQNRLVTALLHRQQFDVQFPANISRITCIWPRSRETGRAVSNTACTEFYSDVSGTKSCCT